MAVKTDNFNRADQTNLGTSSEGWSWSTGDLEIASGGHCDVSANRAIGLNLTQLCTGRAEVDLSTPDNYAQITIVQLGSTGTSDGMGVACRMSGGTGPSYYLAYVLDSGTTLRLYKNTGVQAFTQLGSDVTIAGPLPKILKVQAVGTTIKAFWDGVERISVTDSSITTGLRGGFRYGGPSSIPRLFDNFEMGDVGGSPPAVAQRTYIVNT